MSDYYNRNGDSVDLETWSGLIEDPATRVVQQDTVEGWMVSTVWLGLDHSFGAGAPLIFETMIFPPADVPEDDELSHWEERYTTEQQARDGHERACAMVRLHVAGAR